MTEDELREIRELACKGVPPTIHQARALLTALDEARAEPATVRAECKELAVENVALLKLHSPDGETAGELLIRSMTAVPRTRLIQAAYELFEALNSRPAIDAKGCRCAACQKLADCRRIREEVNGGD